MTSNVLLFVNLLAVSLAIVNSASVTVTVSNVEPRYDIDGNWMDIHDGSLIQWQPPNGLYYWYGMGYGNCKEPLWSCSPGVIQRPKHDMCGFQNNHSINIYTSPDLVHWTFIRNALPMYARPTGIYFRPKVIYHQQNAQYILWVNWVNSNPRVEFWNTTYVIAVASEPEGPFTVMRESVHMVYDNPGDFVLFVDDNDNEHANNTNADANANASAIAYIAYDSASNHHRISIEQLTADYTDTARVNSGVISDVFHEAPAMFYRKGYYYLLFGHCCCFCEHGSGDHVFVNNGGNGNLIMASKWMDAGYNINRHMDDNSSSNISDSIIIHSQQNFIAQIDAGSDGSDGSDGDGNGSAVVQYLWTADRWKSAPDELKSHDFQFWQVLTFDDTVQPPVINRLYWANQTQINI